MANSSGYKVGPQTPEQIADQRKIMRALRARRRALDLTQRQVADRIGCHKTLVSRSESGPDDHCRLGFIRRYAEAVKLKTEVGFSVVRD